MKYSRWPLYSMVVIFFVSAFISCFSVFPSIEPDIFYYAKYDISLIAVERPVEAKQRYGEQRIEMVEQEGIHKYYFEDEMVGILWFVGREQINFVLENKTNHSIKIMWDESAYVDLSGVSHRMMHSGVKHAERNNPQPPTVVVRNGKIEDLVSPTDNVYFDKGYYRYYSSPGSWKTKPLLPFSQVDGDEAKFREKVNACIDHNIQVLLALKIEEAVNDYIFTFKINNAEITKEVETYYIRGLTGP